MELSISQLLLVVFGGGGMLVGFTSALTLYFARRDTSHSRKKEHITESAELRKIDDAKADKLYERLLAQVEKCEADKAESDRRVKKLEKNAREALAQLRDAEKQLDTVLDTIRDGGSLADIKAEAYLFENDIRRIEITLTNE